MFSHPCYFHLMISRTPSSSVQNQPIMSIFSSVSTSHVHFQFCVNQSSVFPALYQPVMFNFSSVSTSHVNFQSCVNQSSVFSALYQTIMFNFSPVSTSHVHFQLCINQSCSFSALSTTQGHFQLCINQSCSFSVLCQPVLFIFSSALTNHIHFQRYQPLKLIFSSVSTSNHFSPASTSHVHFQFCINQACSFLALYQPNQSVIVITGSPPASPTNSQTGIQ